MLVHNNSVVADNDLHLYGDHLIAFDLQWNVVARPCPRRWMDSTLLRYISNPAMDVDRSAEESTTILRAGMSIKRKERSK